MDLKSKLLDPKETVLLYGTTPPRHGTPEDQVSAAAEKLAARVATLPADGIVVYDIQDEAGREFAIDFLSIVGRPTSGIRYSLPLARAIRIASGPATGLTIGGVVIAE